jgi:hypothetical protein
MLIRHFCFFAAMLLPLGAARLDRMPHAAELAAAQHGMLPLTPLTASSTAEIAAARHDAAARMIAVRRELEHQAIGVILDAELELGPLAAELRQDRPDDATLRRIENSLRRILPGRVQASVNDLRESVARLARMIRLSGENLDTGNRALATIETHLRDAGLRSTREGGSALRQAYAEVANLLPSSGAVETIQRHLSIANYTTFLSRDFITAMSRRQFDQPVHFREHRQGASIAGDGAIRITLSATVPESDGENRLLLHAVGAGYIDATADQRRIHVRAGATPSVDGTQLLRIQPTRVSPDAPTVTANFHTRLSGVSLDGLLGQCGLAKRLAARVIESRLTENDRTVAHTIEKSVGDRVREEGISLAYRVNGLLQYAVWDRLAAVDYRPHVRLRNDASGMWSETFYAGNDQLAAVSNRPPIPAERHSALDLITWVHESAVTNSLDFMGGARVDEATARGLWEVQFKLTSSDWESLRPGRTPAAITLQDSSPVSMRFLTGGVELDLRAIGCEIDGEAAASGPCSVRIRYRIDRDENGPRFIREPFAFSDTLPIDKRGIWESVLGLFFAREIRPMPRFPNANVQEFLALDYLDVSDGWLVVGLRRAAAATAPQKHALSEVTR